MIVDAAGYRERRETALHRQADRGVADALRYGRAVELDSMGSQERKVVHNYLKDRADVDTHSRGRRAVPADRDHPAAPAFGDALTGRERFTVKRSRRVWRRASDCRAGSDAQISTAAGGAGRGGRPAPRRCATPAEALDVHVADSLRGAGGAGAGVGAGGSPTSARRRLPGPAAGARAAGGRASTWSSRPAQVRGHRRGWPRRLGLSNARAVTARAEEWGAAAALGGGGRPTTSWSRARSRRWRCWSSTRRRCCATAACWSPGRARALGDEEAAGRPRPRRSGSSVGDVRRSSRSRGRATAHLHLYRKVAPTPAGFPAGRGWPRKRPLGCRQRGPVGPGSSGSGDSRAYGHSAVRWPNLRRLSGDAPARSDRPWSYLRPRHGHRLRDREPEGRRRQDHDRRQPRRLRRGGRLPHAARRPRPAVQRHGRARARRRTSAPTSTTCLCGRRSRSPRRRSPTGIEHLDVVPSTPDLAGATVELPRMPGSESASADGWRRSASATSFTLLDCPPSLGPLTVNALVAADRVIVPVQTEYLALEGLAQLLDTLGSIQRELNPRLKVAGMLLTMYDRRTRLAQDVEREVREHFPELVFETVDPAQRPDRRGAELRRPGDPPRSALRRLGCVLRAREGGRRPWLSARHRPRPGARSCPRPPRHGPRLARLPRTGDEGLREIPLDLIAPNPHQPRRSFDESTLGELAESMRAHGVLQPVLVRPLAGGALRAGRRRAPLARRALAGLEPIPAVVRQTDDGERLELALIENMARAGPQPGRGGARLRGARRGARPHARRRSAGASAAAASRSRT